MEKTYYEGQGRLLAVYYLPPEMHWSTATGNGV